MVKIFAASNCKYFVIENIQTVIWKDLQVCSDFIWARILSICFLSADLLSTVCGNHNIKKGSQFSCTQNSLSFYKKVGVWFTLTVTSRHLFSITFPRNPTAEVKVITDPVPSNIQEIYATSWFLPEETVTQWIHTVTSLFFFFFLRLPLAKLIPGKQLNLCNTISERMEIAEWWKRLIITHAIYSHRKKKMYFHKCRGW